MQSLAQPVIGPIPHVLKGRTLLKCPALSVIKMNDVFRDDPRSL